MRKLFLRKRIFYSSICIVVSFVAMFVWWIGVNHNTKDGIKQTFEKNLSAVYDDIQTKGKYVCSVGDSVATWQDNTIPVGRDEITLLNTDWKNKPVIELKNGIYLHKSYATKDSLQHWFYLIKHKYANPNQYLVNSFCQPFAFDDQIDVVSYQTDIPVQLNGKTICYLDASPECLSPSDKQTFVFKLWFALNIFFILLFTQTFIRKTPKNGLLKVITTTVALSVYALFCIAMCSYTHDFSPKLYSPTVDYDNVFFFVAIALLGFNVYKFCNKILFDKRNKKYSLIRKFALLLLISAVAGTITEIYTIKSYRNNIKAKAENLVKQKDGGDIKNFYILMSSALRDSTVNNLMAQKDFTLAENTVNNYYLNLLKETFWTGVLVFNDSDSMIVAPNNTYVNILAYTLGRIAHCDKIDSLPCVYIEDKDEDINTYIYYNKTQYAHVFAECLKKEKSANMNYSLLLDNSQEHDNNISFAKYIDGHLIYSKGERIFPDSISDKQDGFIGEKSYDSYRKSNKNITYIVSSHVLNGYNIIAFVSIFFLSLMLMFAIDTMLSSKDFWQWKNISIKNAILLSLLVSFVISLLLLGFFGVRGIRNLNMRNNTDTLREKTSSIRLEVARILDSKGTIGENDLIRLSNTFLTDINLFDKKGTLIRTSQPEIFNKGILSDKINAEAYHKLQQNRQHQFYQKETIGTSEFLASYCFVDASYSDNALILNIPFINQQKTMNDNVNDLINNFANMFLFWVNVAIVIFVFLSNWITKPLEMIKEKLAKVNINSQNDKITWDKNDEMGELVKSYNLMIDKIEESSLLLKQQERLSSWRELAKQVAHDIKNPLTPMKLSIQYLQRLKQEKPDLFDAKWQEVAPSLISQIETLSNITGELNSYSRPSVKKEKIDLNKCITSAIHLFANINNVTINYTERPNCYTLGEEKLFIRIFNNLIKNSMQALYNREEGVINIDITEDKDIYTVSFADNGCGIKQEDKDKIFNTHFTTKTDGGGIGLTIVKSILESYDATIDFKSKENVGTVFFIRFLKPSSEQQQA